MNVHMKWLARTAVLAGLSTLTSTAFAETDFETKTKVRLVEKGIWLETEISPQALLAAMPQIDQNRDGRLDEDELSTHRAVILAYYAKNVKLAANEKSLTADSTYFAFRSPATASAVPDRFYIYHWYAVLRRPKRVQLDNRLFGEWQNGGAHQGAIIDGEKIFPFEFFHSEKEADKAGQPVEFELGKTGEITFVESGNEVMQAGYVWLGLGVSGLLALRMASSVRRKLRRQQKAEAREAEETEMEESAVFS